MIGKTPKGAPLRCKFGRHTGQKQGGTMCFECPRCGGTFWQREDFRTVTALADARIARGEGDAAVDWALGEVRRRA